MALHSTEFYKKKVRARRIRITLLLIALIVILSLPIIILRLERFQIRNVEANGNTVTPTSEIQRVVHEAIDGNYFLLIPKSNALIYPKDAVVEELQKQIPRLVQVELDRTDMKSLAVNVEERAPHALYCEHLEDTDGSGCYFLDETGLVFSKAPYFSGNVYFIYTLEDPVSEPLGKKILEQAEFQGLASFVKTLGENRVEARYITVRADKYRLVLGGGAQVIWKRDSDLADVESNFLTFLKSPVITKEDGFLARVEYLDLSIPNKVIYKFRSE